MFVIAIALIMYNYLNTIKLFHTKILSLQSVCQHACFVKKEKETHCFMRTIEETTHLPHCLAQCFQTHKC